MRLLRRSVLKNWAFALTPRRGGATFFFQKCGSLDRLLVYGRWQAAKTARMYVNSGLAALAEMNLLRTAANKQFRAIF